ncbi:MULTISPECIES: 1-phosphofructokinase [unclassified Novosphingobium]|uniref:1-phosphofructokinase n=1 Tax=unclassified Novosphingobium TaxID=2644732 RepID=UPI00146B6FEC|nr:MULTISPECIES: 1-phosphofructokinase [unclassified Novosphingobium]NMN05074.1 1-phosphofructokinase [Novosphingobium sp. SG919]NMN87369.1 1-phosphofructokinase [Novosphingobium sp. SG916]
MRVHTLTLNPAIDETITLDMLVPGQVHRARAVRQNAGGKGINVASCLADWGVAVSAHGLLGRDNAAPFEALFAAKPITDAMVRVDGATRVNLKLVDSAGTTDINLDGLAVTDETLAAVLDGLADMAAAGDMAVLAGSLPPGCPPACYASQVARLRDAGVHVLLDASGEPLARALAAPVLPHVIKPNRDELAAWAGEPLPDIAAVLAAARALHARGVDQVVVSMGSEGALFVNGDGAMHARLALPPIGPLGIPSTVGAGDAMVAGLAAAHVAGLGLAETARLATAFAVAKLGMAGPNLPEKASVLALAQDVITGPRP